MIFFLIFFDIKARQASDNIAVTFFDAPRLLPNCLRTITRPFRPFFSVQQFARAIQGVFLEPPWPVAARVKKKPTSTIRVKPWCGFGSGRERKSLHNVVGRVRIACGTAAGGNRVKFTSDGKIEFTCEFPLRNRKRSVSKQELSNNNDKNT